MELILLKAIYESKRQELILAKLNPQTSKFIDNSLAFAYEVRLCPILHLEGAPTKEDPFIQAYKIKYDFVKKVLDYCYEKGSKQETVTFYELERVFNRGERMSLIYIMRYAFLKGKFDEDFFNSLLTECPREAHNIKFSYDCESYRI